MKQLGLGLNLSIKCLGRLEHLEALVEVADSQLGQRAGAQRQLAEIAKERR